MEVNKQRIAELVVKIQNGDTDIYPFSFMHDTPPENKLPCYLTYTNEKTHEIIKANLVVCKMILKPDFVPEPQLVQFDVDLKKNRHLVALANSITLTPGTITVDLHDNHFLVHALDASLVDGLDDGGFVQQLMQMESSGHSISPGRFDQYMYPYYKADEEAGIIDYDSALELVECLWLKYSEWAWTISKNTARSSAWGHMG